MNKKMLGVFAKHALRGLRFVLGWPEITIPKENFVAVVVHTSFFDVVIIGLYCMEVNIVMALSPKIYALWPDFFSALNFVPSKALEDRGSGGVDSLTKSVRQKAEGQPTIFFISPKGTIQKKEWRSGYKFIAMNLGWPLRTGLLDYSRRTFCFGPPHQHDEDSLQSKLQSELSNNCPLNPRNCEICLSVDYDPYELLSIPDIVCLTNVCLVPAIIKAFYVRESLLGLLSTVSFVSSWAYHSSYEFKGSEVDRNLAVVTILWGLSRMRRISMPFIVHSLLSVFFYALGLGRDSSKVRGTYVVYHSLFHVFVGLASWHSLQSW
jgi:hypothetical protein